MASLHPGLSDFLTVADTVLRVHGASSWTGVSPESGTDRTIELTNCGSVSPLYVNRISKAASLTGPVSSTKYLARIDPGVGPLNVFVPAGQDLAVVSTAAGTSVQSFSFVEVE